MNITILNLTQHPATTDQIAAGVRDLQGAALAMLRQELTFDNQPDVGTVCVHADAIAMLALAWFDAEGVPVTSQDVIIPIDLQTRVAMIGGAPFLMGPLERALISRGIFPAYAFSRREVVEKATADGAVTKTAVFRHEGFVAGGIV